jgi:Bacterial export proteins, family 3
MKEAESGEGRRLERRPAAAADRGVTQIQEQTLTFIPKIIGLAIVLVVRATLGRVFSPKEGD